MLMITIQWHSDFFSPMYMVSVLAFTLIIIVVIYWILTVDQHCIRHFIYIYVSSFNPHNNPKNSINNHIFLQMRKQRSIECQVAGLTLSSQITLLSLPYLNIGYLISLSRVCSLYFRISFYNTWIWKVWTKSDGF